MFPSTSPARAARIRRASVASSLRSGGWRRAIAASRWRWTMIAFAVLGNLPLFFGADLLKATTISGTMVLGLAPPFLLWRLHRPAPAAFHLSFAAGLAVGVAGVVGAWPVALALGSGANSALLGQNVYGLAACFVAYGIGLALEAARARSDDAAAYFEPVAIAEKP
jgi:solute:Na+ symporter, SSS family